MKIRIYYEDTDAGGIVYHTNYIKYCERARSEVFFSEGIIPALDDGSGFVVRHLDASYLATAKLGDTLEVKTTVLLVKYSSVTLRQEIYKGKQKVFSMQIVLVYICKRKPCRIPETFAALFDTLPKVT